MDHPSSGKDITVSEDAEPDPVERSATAPPTPGSMRTDWSRGFAWTSFGAVVQLVSQIVGIVVLGRLLSPTEFGVVGAALVVISIAELFSMLGVGPALVQREELEEDHLAAASQVALLLGAAFSIGVFVGAPWIGSLFEIEAVPEVLRPLSVLFLIHAAATVPTCMLQRTLQFRSIAIANMAASVLGYVTVGVLLAYLGLGVWALVGANLGRAIVSGGILFSMYPHLPPLKPKLKAAGELFRFGAGYTIGRILGDVAVQADRLLVARLLGAEALGLYGRAWQVITVPLSLFGTAVDKVAFPLLSRSQRAEEYLRGAFLQGMTIILAVAMPFGVFLSVQAANVISLLLGPRWDQVVLPFAILAVVLPVRIAAYFSGAVSKAMGEVGSRAVRQGIFAIAVVLGTWAGYRWGLAGVATGVAGAMLVNHLLALQQVVRSLRLRWSDLIWPHVSGVLVGGAVLAPYALGMAMPAAAASGTPILELVVAGASSTLAAVIVWAVLNRRQALAVARILRTRLGYAGKVSA